MLALRRGPFAAGPLLALATLLFVASPAQSQVSVGKITGVVTDAQTGEPLAGAQVFLEGTGRGAITQENGRYFILNVEPGTYEVVAQLIGYATVRRPGVVISTDVTRTVSFQLPSQAVAVEAIIVEAERVPLIETAATGSIVSTTAEQLEALPVTTVEGALALEQGFLAVPDNTTILSFEERRQNPLSPIRIRGGRGGETLMLVDGIPVQNWIYGGPSLNLSTTSVEQIDFIKGGMEPQYGNALSGIINITTPEGGRDYDGRLEYQTSNLAGALGSTPDELLGFDLLQGNVGGPIPGTGDRLRFFIAGRHSNSADRVLEFDDDIFIPSQRSNAVNTPDQLDLFPGWRAFGFSQQRDILGKLTYHFSPSTKLDLTLLNWELESQQFDFDFVLTGFDPLQTPAARTAADSVYLANFREERDVVLGTNKLDRTLMGLTFRQTLGRTGYKLTAGVFDQSRLRCNFFQGFCLEDNFGDLNFAGRFVASGIESSNPTQGTDNFYGGEDLRTFVARGDVVSQVTDHHSLQLGVYYESHDLDFLEFQAIESDQPFKVQQAFASDASGGIPLTSDLWNAAAYVQDKIEYDFIKLALGFRFDIGQAGGLFFADPLDPNNGTTAATVCGNPTRFHADPTFFTGLESCASKVVRDSAAVIAHRDDLVEPDLRTQFSPRLGVSFPVTEVSSLFFNYGRNSQNPLLTNLFRNTFIGTAGEGVPCGAPFLVRNPLPDGTLGPPDGEPDARPLDAAEKGLCGPVLVSPRLGQQFLGNPNLVTEATNSYELGFLTEIGENWAGSIILFNKDQFGLTGVREGRLNDPGETYGASSATFSILVNQDFQTVRGLEIALRRRLADYWSANINYSFSQSRTNAAPPQREFEAQEEEGDLNLRREITSEIDRPHVFNATLAFRVLEDTPDVPFGEWLTNFSLSGTFQAWSGFPFTPVPVFNVAADERAERNSGRMPASWLVDLQAFKGFEVDNLTYGLFVRVDNLFDTENCVQVFETTGNCHEGTIDQARARIGNPVSEQTSSTFFDRPHFIGGRRSINMGLRVEF